MYAFQIVENSYIFIIDFSEFRVPVFCAVVHTELVRWPFYFIPEIVEENYVTLFSQYCCYHLL